MLLRVRQNFIDKHDLLTIDLPTHHTRDEITRWAQLYSPCQSGGSVSAPLRIFPALRKLQHTPFGTTCTASRSDSPLRTHLPATQTQNIQQIWNLQGIYTKLKCFI